MQQLVAVFTEIMSTALIAKLFGLLFSKMLLQKKPQMHQEEELEPYRHWVLTGKYLWKGVEYTTAPYKLEVDTGRGVLYLHSLLTGQTVLRICRIPEETTMVFLAGRSPTLDIMAAHPRRIEARELGSIVEFSPVFLNIAGPFPPEERGAFTIETESGRILFEVVGVPRREMKSLWMGEFTDITIGLTGRVE